jgi:hypothetical protein
LVCHVMHDRHYDRIVCHCSADCLALVEVTVSRDLFVAILEELNELCMVIAWQTKDTRSEVF